MTIQTPTQTGARILPLQKYAPGPLEAVGKLRYMPQQRGTAPVGRARAFLHGSFPENLRLSVGGDSAKARARLERCMEVRENSRRIGSLLGSLSAPANDARALSRIAKELGLISELTREVTFFFYGWERALYACLKAMTHPELIALCEGIFNHPQACDAVLEQISPAELRSSAAGVLNKIRAALYEQLAHVIVSEPLGKIIDALNDTPVDAEELEAQLLKLHADMAAPHISRLMDRFPADSMLEIYFRSLKRNKLAARMVDLQRQKLLAADKALCELSDGPEQRLARTVLERVHIAFGCELYEKWVGPRVEYLQDYVDGLKAAPDLSRAQAAARSFIDLWREFNAFEWAPEEVQLEMGQLLSDIDVIVEDARNRELQMPAGSASEAV